MFDWLGDVGDYVSGGVDWVDSALKDTDNWFDDGINDVASILGQTTGIIGNISGMVGGVQDSLLNSRLIQSRNTNPTTLGSITETASSNSNLLMIGAIAVIALFMAKR